MPGMAIVMALSAHVLAERLCHAEHKPLWPWLADVYEKSECLSPAASIEKAKDAEATVASMSVADAMEGLGLQQAKTPDLEHADTQVKDLALSESENGQSRSQRQSVVAELNAISAALSLCFNVSNVYMAIKIQFVRSMHGRLMDGEAAFRESNFQGTSLLRRSACDISQAPAAAKLFTSSS